MNTKTLWFQTWHQATAFSNRWGLNQAPKKRPVWLDLEWREEWSLVVPIEWTAPLLNNQPTS
jgi:hypothetical protein